MNVTDILSFLRKPASGSAALRAKLSEVEAAIPGSEAEASRLAAERSSLLLSANDRDIEAVERREADARRSVDRLRAASEELARRLALADAAEARAALDAERAEAERLATETAERVRKEYVKAARVIDALVAEVDTAERRVAEVNARLEAAGRLDDFLKPVESRAIPEPSEVRPEPFRLAACSLVPAPGFAGLGVARDRAAWAGIVADILG